MTLYRATLNGRTELTRRGLADPTELSYELRATSPDPGEAVDRAVAWAQPAWCVLRLLWQREVRLLLFERVIAGQGQGRPLQKVDWRQTASSDHVPHGDQPDVTAAFCLTRHVTATGEFEGGDRKLFVEVSAESRGPDQRRVLEALDAVLGVPFPEPDTGLLAKLRNLPNPGETVSKRLPELGGLLIQLSRDVPD